MINKPNGWDNARTYTDGGEQLPPGGYVIKILNTKIEKYGSSEKLVLQIDINEGEHFEFYKEQWENQTQEDKKWKGRFDMWLPKNDGSEQDGWTISRMKTNIAAIEDSNKGYHWDWNEQTLVGKIVGALFNTKEFKNDKGEVIAFTQCKYLTDVEKIRSGKFKIPKDDLLDGGRASAGVSRVPEGFERLSDKDVPF